MHLIANNLGLSTNNKTTYSQLHNYIAKSKPSGISVFDYMRKLYTAYRIGLKKGKKVPTLKRRKRKSTQERNKQSQNRKGTGEYIAEQFHNELQEQLNKVLIKKYGAENIIMGENYVDMKVLQLKEIQYYEVKTSGFAEDCIIQSIGQLLSYQF